MDRYCRVCGCKLDLDNIYPSKIKKCDWICKVCDDKGRNERRDASKHGVVIDQWYTNDACNCKTIPHEVDCAANATINELPFGGTTTPVEKTNFDTLKHGSMANFTRDVIDTTRYCKFCSAFNSITNRCHLNPPINGFPHVDPNDHCMQFVGKT